MSDYTLSVSTTAQGGGTASDQIFKISYIVGQASPAGTGSSGTTKVSSGLVTLLGDLMPPVILHSPPALAVPDRTALEVTADIEDNRAGVAAAGIYYREGGAAAFRLSTMSFSEGAYSGTIPPSAVTEKGLLYYIEATDLAGNVSRYPDGAPDSLISTRVWFEEVQAGFEMPAGEYRMISLPGSTSGSPEDILIDDLGSYDRKVWRLGRWNPSISCSTDCYEEYPDLTGMDRGRAFWLVTKSSTGFDASGLSTLPESPFRVHIERGWNQIGTPFAFMTDWLATEILFDGAVYALNEEHIVGSDTIYVEDNLVSYDGAYHGHESSMEPWSGYWIYNGSTQDVDLLVKPSGGTPALASSPGPRGDFDLQIEIIASSPDFPERTALAGLGPEARDGWDAQDHHEPPPVGDYMRLVFDRPEWGSRRGLYMTDIRRSDGEGAHWTFTAQASKATEATVEILTRGVMPQGWDLFLYDGARGLRLGAADLPYSFQLERTHDLGLIVGTEDFIRRRESEAGIALRAQIMSVAPNPFRDGVDITCFTPERTRIELEVYSVEGRLVSATESFAAGGGMHRIRWNGRARRSGDAAPGLYFARVKMGGTTHKAKIIKLR
jgi:hypothetical protein